MRLRILARILAAQSLSSLGTSISTIALSYMVLKITGSVMQMGGVMAISTFPLVVTSFIGGALLDRFSARNAMILADVCRAALIFSMPFLAEQSTFFSTCGGHMECSRRSSIGAGEDLADLASGRNW